MFVTPYKQANEKDGQTHKTHVMIADDTCRNRVNKPITLHRGDQVEIYRSVQTSDPATKRLPPHDPLSMKVNLTYVRAATGQQAGEYCWVATVNVR